MTDEWTSAGVEHVAHAFSDESVKAIPVALDESGERQRGDDE